ncbi:MAG TPA: hypothetical protein VN999_01310 [Thermoanaerobaculia bacterium]|nr:hypothetical protein [Thermoanaerobaculia bacterium]
MAPIVIVRCFLPEAEVGVIIGSIGHDPQASLTDPAYDSGKQNPDGSLRPPLVAVEIASLIDMHAVLDPDMSEGAVVRKYVPNSDVGGYLYGRTVISSSGKLIVVTTDTVRGFVGLERNTLGLDAGQTIGAVGLDYETVELGQFTDATSSPLHRQVSREVQDHGLHVLRHVMTAAGAVAAQIPLGKNLNAAVVAAAPRLGGRTFEMDRQGASNPYTGLGISDDIGLLVLQDPTRQYPLHLNEEDVMTTATPLAAGDRLLRRDLRGDDTLIANYTAVTAGDGTVSNVWQLSPKLSAADTAYYQRLIGQAAARVAAAGGEASSGSAAASAKTPLLPRPAPTSCPPANAPGTPRLLEAKVTACRAGDEDLRSALAAFRPDYDTPVQIPQRLQGGQRLQARPYDDLVEQRVRRIGGVIVRLEPRRYRDLSEPPAPGRKPTASGWAKLDDAKPRDYFLRLEHADCRSAPRGTAYFVTADACCDTLPPTDDACLLKLPAIALPPQELEDLETGE